MIIIIADLHDNLVTLEKTLTWANNNQVEVICCCGDVTDAETIKFLATNFLKTIYLIRGNMDNFPETEPNKYNNIKYLGRFGNFIFNNKTIGLCHEPQYLKDVVTEATCDIIFYGHTHKPWTAYTNELDKQIKEKVLAVNPGTLGGVFTRATFAVWDEINNKLDLKLVESI